MAVESISSLFSENPITTLTDDYMFEVAGDAGAGVVSGATKLVTIKAYVAAIGGSTGAVDNAVLRANGTGGVTVQSSAVIINDSGDVHATSITSDGLVDVGSTGIRIGTAFYIQTNATGVMILIDGGGNPMNRIILGQGGSSSPSLSSSGATMTARTNDGTAYAPFQASIFTGSGSGLTGIPGAWTIGSGYLANTSGGNKAIAVGDYTAVNFSALDPTNIGLGALSTQVDNLTKKFLAVYADALNLIAPNA